MRSLFILICIICLSFNAYSQDCQIPAINYNPKEVIGNYSLYEFTPNTPQNSKDSVLLITAIYDSIELTQMKIMYANVHSMAGAYRDPGIDKMQLDSNRNILSQKIYGEGKTYDGKYKYISLDQCSYNDKGYLLSESTYASSNIPLTFVYTDSSFEQVIKQNYSHRAGPDCISRYHYKDSLILVIENYKDGALTFKNLLTYTAGNVTEAKAYKPDGTLFSTIKFSHSPKGFTQTLFFYSGKGDALKKAEDSYYWKYTKEQGRIVELEYGKNSIVIDKNRYAYDAKGRIASVKMYDAKVLKYLHKYYYN